MALGWTVAGGRSSSGGDEGDNGEGKVQLLGQEDAGGRALYRFGQRGISRRHLTARSEVGGRGWHLDGDYAAIRSEWEQE